LFHWKEPRECRRTLLAVAAAKTKWWHKPAVALLIAGSLLLSWLQAGCNPNNQRPPFAVVLPLSIPGGLVLAYGIPWLYSLCPANIMVFKDRLCRVVGDTHQAWKWADISAYGWLDCGEYDLLVLEHCKGFQVLVGVPRDVSRAELEHFLANRGQEEVRTESNTPADRPHE